MSQAHTYPPATVQHTLCRILRHGCASPSLPRHHPNAFRDRNPSYRRFRFSERNCRKIFVSSLALTTRRHRSSKLADNTCIIWPVSAVSRRRRRGTKDTRPVSRLVSDAKTPHAARTAQRLRGAVRRKPLRANRLGRMRSQSSWPSPRPSPIAHRETGVLPNALWGEGAQPRRKSLRPPREGGRRQGDRSLG